MSVGIILSIEIWIGLAQIFTALLESPISDFPGGTVVKNLPANAGDTGSIPSPGRSHMPQSN